MTGPLDRWYGGLIGRVGCSAAEVAEHRAALTLFCARHDITPETLLHTWQEYPELTVRRRPGAPERPNPAVESFLIHNGVNVFGDIVCVPGRPRDLADQGARFVPVPSTGAPPAGPPPAGPTGSDDAGRTR